MMDYIPSVFSQNDLFWLDNLMPIRKKTDKKKKKKNLMKQVTDEGTTEVTSYHLTTQIFSIIFRSLRH